MNSPKTEAACLQWPFACLFNNSTLVTAGVSATLSICQAVVISARSAGVTLQESCRLELRSSMQQQQQQSCRSQFAKDTFAN